MTILIFSNNGRECEERLVEAVQSLTQRPVLEFAHSISELTKRFRRPRGDLAVMVLLAGSRKDLEDLHLIKDLFFDIPIILIFPDGHKETVWLGFKLTPRYVTYDDSTFEDVKGVLEKMLRHYDKKTFLKTEEVLKAIRKPKMKKVKLGI